MEVRINELEASLKTLSVKGEQVVRDTGQVMEKMVEVVPPPAQKSFATSASVVHDVSPHLKRTNVLTKSTTTKNSRTSKTFAQGCSASGRRRGRGRRREPVQ